MRRLLAITCLVVLSCGCATPAGKNGGSFDPSTAPASDVRIRIVMPQEEVYVPLHEDDYFNGDRTDKDKDNFSAKMKDDAVGLGRAFKNLATLQHPEFDWARKRIEPLRASSIDVEFRAPFRNALKDVLAHSTWLKPSSIETEDKRDISEPDAVMRGTGNYLHIRTGYQLTDDYRALWATTSVKFYQGTSPVPAYSRVFQYYSANLAVTGRSRSIETWSADNAALYRKVVAEAQQQNLTMFRLDFSERSDALKDAHTPQSSLKTRDIVWKGRILEQSDLRFIMRVASGNIVSLPKADARVTP